MGETGTKGTKRYFRVAGSGGARGIRRGLVAAAVGGVLLASGCRTDDAAIDVDGTGRPSAGTSAAGDGADQGSAGGGLRVTGVSLAVVPASLTSVKCKTAVPESYTAVITLAEGHRGGKVTVRYGATSSTMKDTMKDTMKEETLSVPAGKTSVTKSFFHSEYIMSNSLAAAQVNVVAPDLVQSATVRPTGACSDGGMWDMGTDSGATGGY
ncbi:hypothetical protein ACH4ZX_29545 [Streptomyces sp. NPDC020490]|uniref:hypothetical protein n=1 Tax=Streptomyces sp. NPDC020490 TaxID=3365078 RepID=UPI00378F352E